MKLFPMQLQQIIFNKEETYRKMRLPTRLKVLCSSMTQNKNSISSSHKAVLTLMQKWKNGIQVSINFGKIISGKNLVYIKRGIDAQDEITEQFLNGADVRQTI